MSGRAGRRGLDSTGVVIIANGIKDEIASVLYLYFIFIEHYVIQYDIGK